MLSYWIARAHIVDPVGYRAYADAAVVASRNALVSPQILAGGGKHLILEGTPKFERHVLLAFPRFTDATGFYHSTAYQAAAALRRNGAGINELVIVEGHDQQTSAPSAQKTAAYWIGRSKLIDSAPMAEYGRLAALARARYPYKTLVLGGRYQVIEGEASFDRFVIHEFPSVDAALGFYHSPEYQQAIVLRRQATAGHADLVLVEGA